VLVQDLIEKCFGVVYHPHYVAELLKHTDFSFQKARFVSDHLSEAARTEGIEQTWPETLRLAKRRHAMILFGDEARRPPRTRGLERDPCSRSAPIEPPLPRAPRGPAAHIGDQEALKVIQCPFAPVDERTMHPRVASRLVYEVAREPFAHSSTIC